MLKDLFMRFKWRILIATLLSAISAGMTLGMISIITDVVNDMDSEGFAPAYSFMTFVGVLIAVISFGFISQWIMLKLGTTVVYEVQKTILERILGTRYQTIEKHGNHKVMAAMKDDVGAVAGVLTALPGFTSAAVTVIFCMGYMIYVAWQLFILVILTVVIIMIITQLALAYSYIRQESLREDYDSFFSNLNALANGGKDLHVSQTRKRYFYNKLMVPVFKSMKKKTIEASAAFIGLDSLVTTLVIFLIGVIVYTSLYYFPEFDKSVIITFTLVILYMIDPLGSVLEIGEEVNALRVSLKKITNLELVESSEFLESLKRPIKPQHSWSEIRLKEARFIHESREEFDNYKFQLGPISADFKAGEVTFITGGNGSGKSTIAKLLAGLYKLESGSVFVDNKEIGENGDISVEEFQDSLSVIFADSFVFSEILDSQGSIAEDDHIRGHIDRLQLTERIDAKDGKVTSTKLSTGQGKRLSLLQSFMVDAQVCLYDEWAADQDPKFKEYFYKTILPELKNKGKIVIVISHDSQYFDSADKLLSLEDGKVINVKQLT